MREFSRRGVLGLGAGAAAALSVAGCSFLGSSESGKVGTKPGGTAKAKPIGDGSTAYTGKQPNQQPAPEKLEPGQKPPQFVVFSWDGAGDVDNGLFPRFRKIAKDHNASMTFFLSGLYLLPESKRRMYRPPNNPVGASAIEFLTDDHIKSTLKSLRAAWLEGHEIGTHFNGHFCESSGKGSVEFWTPAQWDDEIEQAMSFVTKWKTNTGFTDVEPLPFDYSKELVGGRTPCLLGQENLLPTARKRGWRYDASSKGGLQIWPARKQGVWDLPLQQVPFRSFETLSMDYNFMFNQSKNSTKAPPANYPGWRKQVTDAYIAGFKRAYETNRAPFFIGNHFEQWNGGIYMDAVEEAIKHIAGGQHKDVRLVSFRQLCDWLDAQDPKVLADLRRLGVGQKFTTRR
ncbi:hypothetical protein ACPCUV_04025 [Streptomyces platensis]|uniref:hypothetical protein n=1 Tax=Streptomyces platensis TaxID=58346 RepID=UPI003C2BEA63